MNPRLIGSGAVFAFLGVLIGAFGAHALRGQLSASARSTYETGVLYQMLHALALMALGSFAGANPPRKLVWAGRLFGAGIVLFSFSLYALAITGATALGAITPLGGLCFLTAWALVAVWAFQRR